MILLDRDGVLNVDRADSVKTLEELEIETGAVDGSARLSAAGFTLAVVSNQSAVGRGWMSRTVLDAVNAEIDRRLGGTLTHWYICDHPPSEGCRCRKPGTLLLEQAHQELGFDPGQTWFVGDAGRDIEAARRFGVQPALVRTGKGVRTASENPDVPVWDDLDAFARWVIARGT